ncbi:hypothetical protein UFOVP141_55 [uncultured Caudovirales phage]|uniref:Uncharacterized protein n=1 Tax=uncultured Caudovirales phage TaxID=2100421 RepID=A0A6J7VKM1_9CAUD|nr:hypothetical protein UFOVP141_55 [uncultured Caudovirales phage]
MPARLQDTFAECRDRVLINLRNPNDGSVNPQTIMTVDQQIREAQELLFAKSSWIIERDERTFTLVAGSHYIPIDADQEAGRVERAYLLIDSTPYKLTVKDDLVLEHGGRSQPLHYRIISTIGVVEVEVVSGGSDYNDGDPVVFTGGNPVEAAEGIVHVDSGSIYEIEITKSGSGYQSTPSVSIADGKDSILRVKRNFIPAIRLIPTPDKAYQLHVDFLRRPAKLASDLDRLTYDSKAVSDLASSLAANILGKPHAKQLADIARVYLEARASMESDKEGSSLIAQRNGAETVNRPYEPGWRDRTWR